MKIVHPKISQTGTARPRPGLLIALAALATAAVRGDITYVDAGEGASGNTYATGGAPDDTGWLDPAGGPSAIDDQWAKRSLGNDATLLQAFHNGDQMPELTTEIAGLADGVYDVWVFFWDGPNANTWTISAGLDSGALTTYSHDGPGDTTSPVDAGTLDFSNDPMVSEGPRILYGVKLGQTNVTAGSPVEVFIDNLVGGGSNTRTWYDGVGYSLVVPDGDDTDGDGLPDDYEQTIIDADDGDDVRDLADVMGTGDAPAVTDFDADGSDDAEEYFRGTDPLDGDSDNDGLLDGVETDTGVFVSADDTGTDPLDDDSDNDGLLDGVETGTGTFVDAENTGTDPLNSDTDGDGLSDGFEVDSGTDPIDGDDPPDPLADVGPRLFGIDFNRDDALGSPSQSLFRVVSGSTTQTENAASYTKTIGAREITITQPDGARLEFRGANTDGSRAIPGGDISRSFLVSDFIATREGAIDLEITGLEAGDYVFRSFHLDTFTGSGLGFAQGSGTTTPNTIQARIAGMARIGGEPWAEIQPTGLGADGLGTTFLDDSQIPTLAFAFTHDGSSPLVIELRSTQSNRNGNHLLLNGFEIFQDAP